MTPRERKLGEAVRKYHRCAFARFQYVQFDTVGCHRSLSDVAHRSTMARVDSELRTAYLRRLGLDAEPPTVDALQRLHRRQVERVPYETMWIALGEGWTIDLDDTVRRVALQ